MFNDADSFSHRHSFVRVKVSAPTVPPISRTFDTCPEAPQSWLVDAFLLAAGRPEQKDPDDRGDGRISQVVTPLYWGAPSWRFDDESDLDDRAVSTIDIPGFEPACLVQTLSRRSAAYGEPHLQIVDDDDKSTASAQWQTTPAPLRREHLQQELTRRFGLVTPEYDEPQNDVDSPDLAALLHDLPPERRLALRAYLADAGILDPSPMDPVHAHDLLTGLRWLVDRLGPDGIEENEHRELPNWLAREAEAALSWESIPDAPPSPGHALIALARTARFVRRLHGRVLPTARTRTMLDKPVRSVADVRQAFRNQHSGSEWGHDHARTLALLTITDENTFDTAEAARCTVEGLRVLTPSADDLEECARKAVHDLMDVLSPLGTHGGYGRLTPAVRAFARAQLFPQTLPGYW